MMPRLHDDRGDDVSAQACEVARCPSSSSASKGWDISDFGTPWPRGKLPADAEPVEFVVGFLDMERASGIRATAADFNGKSAAYYEQHGIPGRFQLTDNDLAHPRPPRRAVRTVGRSS